MNSLESALARLNSRWSIAWWLWWHGYRGRPLNGQRCPVARYLQHELKTTDVFVDEYDARSPSQFLSAAHRVPPRVAHFIKRFDDGDYPLLLARTDS